MIHNHNFILGKTHIKRNVFFSGQTTKGVGRVNPRPLSKKTLFFYKFGFFSPKIGEKKNCQNPFQAIIRLKKRKKSGMDHYAISVGRVKP